MTHLRLVAGLAVLAATTLSAQVPARDSAGVESRLRARAVPVLLYSNLTPGDHALTEARILQPVLAGDLRWRRLIALTVTLNLEGATLEHGELALGNWGEGFVDRRHPHTWLHEAMLVGTSPDRGFWQAGVGVGKGFATFGTDDPMSRPAVRYPVNHHLAQVLERAVALGQIRGGPVLLEGSIFNGDEPSEPNDWPNLDRFGDSWAVRGTLAPWEGLEAQLSRAMVASPEHREGAGLDHWQWSASLRYERAVAAGPLYLMAEWARVDVGQEDFRFESWLAEGAIRLGRVRPYYRFERTERPEEERISAFHSRRPPLDNSIVGTSRWTTHTAGTTVSLRLGGWQLEPLAELSAGSIAKVGAGLFQVSDWYERSSWLAISVGIRIDLGMEGHRMGRYGLAAPGTHGGHDQ